jgi:transcriptional regulator with XRE-family HTH domain
MSDKDTKTAEEVVGANIKFWRAKLGLTQVGLAEAMQGLGHSWIQTTVAKTEAADRPLRVNEVADLAKILGVRVPHLVSSRTDWELEAINITLSHAMSHALRLKAEIEELNRQVAAKTAAYEEARKRVRELDAEYKQVVTDNAGLTDTAVLDRSLDDTDGAGVAAQDTDGIDS